jgi:hypothetical protein
MATMYPRYLKTDRELEEERLNPISPAERKLFDLFNKNLDDDYAVFHGVALHMPRQRSGGISDREIDFLIAHPEHGLLTLEVKGGLIQIDGSIGEWTSKDRFGKKHSIKDPFEQVKQASYGLHGVLLQVDTLKGFNYSTWYGVALPDVDVEEDLGPAARRAIVIDRTDILADQIQESIERIFKYYHRKGQQSPGKKGIRALTRKLAPDWFLRSHLATDFEHEEEQFNQLTMQQYAVLEFIEDKPRALIAGCAGSGKTMLAMEKARRLCNDGKRVLLTCYNSPLSGWLNETAEHENLTIKHFHSLALDVAKEAGEPIPWMTDLKMGAEEYWGNHVPMALFDIAAELPEKERYDAIIVDEGQDFKSTYWEALQMLLKDPDRGTLYIFYDDSQRLYSDDKFPLPEPAGRLNKNLRSTHEIGSKVIEYYQGVGTLEAAGPVSGHDVEIIDLSKYETPQDALEDVLGMLSDEKVPPGDIVLLSPLGKEKSQWKHKTEVGEFMLWRGDTIKGNRIQVETIHGFKGLERPVLILSELNESSADDRVNLVYVALSRARHYVVVLGELPKAKA